MKNLCVKPTTNSLDETVVCGRNSLPLLWSCRKHNQIDWVISRTDEQIL